MFDVKTPKRTYYLAAETEEDMNKWVDCVCHVCGLKSYSQEESIYPYVDDSTSLAEDSSQADSPPVSPSSTASGPYIPISECTSGFRSGTNDCDEDSYDQPRRIELSSSIDWRNANPEISPLHSPPSTNTDHDSVFTDDDGDLRPSVNWTTFPHPSDSSLDEVKVVSSGGHRRYTKPVAPPRPPKPGHLSVQDSKDSPTYSNLDSPVSTAPRASDLIHDDMYDFPRSHHLPSGQESDPVPHPRQRQYTNAQPTGSGVIFRYDIPLDYGSDEPSSPRSETAKVPPPAVHRDLKPGRKTSDSISNEPSPVHPNIDLDRLRILKPPKIIHSRTKDETVPLKLCAPPFRRSDYSTHNPRYCSSNTLRSVSQGESDDIEQDTAETLDRNRFGSFNIYSSRPTGSKQIEIQYLDLDLDANDNTSSPASTSGETTGTVYKEVDFVKTEAFNRTRQKVEEERKQCSDISQKSNG
ncbi:hypothetical protein O3M35_011643 [Rhynocoris fuscipes]|uniref:PH domain-containing protein n=1 Tax=Rhynocoris fuscipes TaxID=488301 RepID=A0AAW1CXD3_9HEMI